MNFISITKYIGLIVSGLTGVALALNGQTEAGVGIIAASLSSANINGGK